jgi:hydroxyacid-oxoacid transhydrogenase
MQTVMESLERNNVDYTIYDRVRVEPSDGSFQDAISFLSQMEYDGVVALGGGSVMDTAKAANLYACHPPESFYDYVNPPIGRGIPIPGPLKPVICIPTTAGTGSETTGVAIFDDTPSRSKTGIANRHLKPTLGIIDPENTGTLPIKVATYTGLDVLCHAIESYTALPFNQRIRPNSPLDRPAYQGSNPISDVWSLFALRTCAEYLPLAAVQDPTNNEAARAKMLLASAAAGMGFGNAGVHLCHGMSYPISSQVRDYVGYDRDVVDHPLIPHGLSVIVGAPAVFRFTGEANDRDNQERHATCARILARSRLGGRPPPDKPLSAAGQWLAEEIMELCQLLSVPMGLQTFGYTSADVPALVEGTIQQHRVTKISPRPVGRTELEALFLDAMDA